MAAATVKPTQKPSGKTPTKKPNSDPDVFHLGTEKWQDTFPRNLVRHGLKTGSFISICYPYKFAYCLVKFGYIPKRIVQYLTVKNEQMLRVPSVKEYMDFMKDDEGEQLWMRGEVCFCATYIIYDIVIACMLEFLIEEGQPEKSLREEYLESLYVTSVSVFVAVVVTQPFTVLSHRQIGQYVGKEDTYSSVFGLISVIYKPGILTFLEGTLATYVYNVIPTYFGNITSRTWNMWLERRIPWLPQPTKFLKFTEKGTNYEWLRPTIDWCLDVSVYYWVAVLLSPLEIACITSSVWNSGIEVGSEPFIPQGHFFKRFFSMWKDGKLFRSSPFYFPRLTRDMDAFVVF